MANRQYLLDGAWLGGAISLLLMAILYLLNQVAGLPFLPFDLFDWLARVLPGGIVTFFIDTMVRILPSLGLGATDAVAKLIEEALAVGLIVVGGMLVGVLVAWFRGRTRREVGRHDPGRRTVLVKIGAASLAFALAGWGLGRLLAAAGNQTGASRDLPGNLYSQPPIPSGRIDPVPGTRPEVTPLDRFYRIDIDLRPELIAEDAWSLSVDGLFDRPHRLRLPDLMAYPAVTQPITLSCISNPVGGDLIGTGYWTGVQLAYLLADMGIGAGARGLRIDASDGFYESVSMDDLNDPRTLLVYGMDGKTLTEPHGFPLRIYIPNRYGMKQPKWITRIVAVDRETSGYWVERGWDREARPQIVSVIDTVATDEARAGRVPIGGIAWAGGRGVQRVEVQVDGGPWGEAELRTPTIGPLTWIQWRYHWPAPSGRHTFKVRATDGTGALQVEQESGPGPSGATGYHSVTRTI